MVNPIIEELLQIPSNSMCADCLTNASTHTSCIFGIFICHRCCQFHQSISYGRSKILALNSTEFTENDIKMLRNIGNEKSNMGYEKNLPLCYKRPTYNDPLVLMEQWIQGKYERKEFDEFSSRPAYMNNVFEGYLWKRGKDNRQFKVRKFVLNKNCRELTYYTKEARDAEAKATLKVESLDVFIQPDKVGKPFGMQIMVEGADVTRSLFVYAETGEEMVNWYTAIYACKLQWKRIAFPSTPVTDFYKTMWPSVVKEGWLMKRGPKSKDTFYRRWVVLVKRKLLYYAEPMDAFPKGEVFIGSKELGGYSVRAPHDLWSGVDDADDDNKRLSASSSGGSTSAGSSVQKKSDKSAEKVWVFGVETPKRTFTFQAESEVARKEWMEAVQSLIDQPLSSSDQKTLNRTGVQKVNLKRFSNFLFKNNK